MTLMGDHPAGEPYQVRVHETKSQDKVLKTSQYVGSDANTVPFEQVPAVIEARQIIQDRIQQSLNKVAEFNEVLR